MHYYKVKNIVTNAQDGNLLNPTDFTIQTTGTVSGEPEFWVANEKTGTVTHYDLDGHRLVYTNLTVTAVTVGAIGTPTGIVHNISNHFAVTQNGISGRSVILVCTRDGQILGWNPAVNPTTFVSAYTSTDGAVYTGLEIVGSLIYATDFHNNKIDVFNTAFVLQPSTSYPFTDPMSISTFNAYNISYVNGILVVTYAVIDGNNFPVKGPGFGIANEFDSNGNLIRRLVNNNDDLNVPYGMTNVNDYFARPSNNSMFFGNVGDGTIQQRDMTTGDIQQHIKNKCGENIVIVNLHALNSYEDVLVFVAGDSTGGHLGFIEKKCYCPPKENKCSPHKRSEGCCKKEKKCCYKY